VRRAERGPHAVESEQLAVASCFGQPVAVEQYTRAGRQPLRTLDASGMQAGALRQFGRGERIPDRAQILRFVLRRFQALTQQGEICFSHGGLCAQARIQDLLAALSSTAVDDVPRLGGRIGAQLTKLLLVLAGVFAHAVRGTVGDMAWAVSSSPIAGATVDPTIGVPCLNGS
jgi:hypothetical protein